MDRPTGKKHGRSGRGGARSKKAGPPGRRTPPPASTGREAEFFASALRAATPLVLVLSDGRKLRGTLAEVDRDQVTLETPTGAVVIRKTEIRYLYAKP